MQPESLIRSKHVYPQTTKLTTNILSKAGLGKLHSGLHFVSFCTSIASIASLAHIAQVTCTVKQKGRLLSLFVWSILKWNAYRMHTPSLSLVLPCFTRLSGCIRPCSCFGLAETPAGSLGCLRKQVALACLVGSDTRASAGSLSNISFTRDQPL